MVHRGSESITHEDNRYCVILLLLPYQWNQASFGHEHVYGIVDLILLELCRNLRKYGLCSPMVVELVRRVVGS